MRNLRPHVAILDISLPDLTVLEILATANAENLSTRVVFFTASIEQGELVAATAAGTCSIIPKGYGARNPGRIPPANSGWLPPPASARSSA